MYKVVYVIFMWINFIALVGFLVHSDQIEQEDSGSLHGLNVLNILCLLPILPAIIIYTTLLWRPFKKKK